MSTTKSISSAAPIPDALAEAALVDINTCAATGNVSPSKWQAEVNAGRAPQPVVRQPRFTRWRLVDVKAYWLRVAEEGAMGEASTEPRAPRQARIDAMKAGPRGQAAAA